MAEVTVGVPVYNGEAFLAESLECLRTQSFGDIQVVIYDNASTDRSPAIAEDFVARDPRFRLVRQPQNRGAMANFRQALMEARAPFFMWRAFDDLSDPNYIEELHGLLVRNADAAFASCTIDTENVDGSQPRVSPIIDLGDPRSLAATTRRLFQSHASWFYGLWRTSVLQAEWDRCTRIYPHAWGCDHMMMLAYLLDGRVVLTDRTHFLQRIKRTAGPRRRTHHASVAEVARMRDEAFAYADSLLRERYSGPELAVMQAVIFAWVGKRIYKLRKLYRRRMMGIVKPSIRERTA
jgi:glycosyltransferase involved in cell wall biosynthesis